MSLILNPILELTSGEISQYNLWQRLTAPGLTPIEREIITSALNIFNANSNNGNSGLFPKQIQPPAAIYQPAAAQNAMMMNALTAPIQGGSPLSPVPPLDQHLLFQHQAAAAAAAAAANKQLRLSPLPAGKSFDYLDPFYSSIETFPINFCFPIKFCCTLSRIFNGSSCVAIKQYFDTPCARYLLEFIADP